MFVLSFRDSIYWIPALFDQQKIEEIWWRGELKADIYVWSL